MFFLLLLLLVLLRGMSYILDVLSVLALLALLSHIAQFQVPTPFNAGSTVHGSSPAVPEQRIFKVLKVDTHISLAPDSSAPTEMDFCPFSRDVARLESSAPLSVFSSGTVTPVATSSPPSSIDAFVSSALLSKSSVHSSQDSFSSTARRSSDSSTAIPSPISCSSSISTNAIGSPSSKVLHVTSPSVPAASAISSPDSKSNMTATTTIPNAIPPSSPSLSSTASAATRTATPSASTLDVVCTPAFPLTPPVSPNFTAVVLPLSLPCAANASIDAVATVTPPASPQRGDAIVSVAGRASGSAGSVADGEVASESKDEVKKKEGEMKSSKSLDEVDAALRPPAFLPTLPVSPNPKARVVPLPPPCAANTSADTVATPPASPQPGEEVASVASEASGSPGSAAGGTVQEDTEKKNVKSVKKKETAKKVKTSSKLLVEVDADVRPPEPAELGGEGKSEVHLKSDPVEERACYSTSSTCHAATDTTPSDIPPASSSSNFTPGDDLMVIDEAEKNGSGGDGTKKKNKKKKKKAKKVADAAKRAEGVSECSTSTTPPPQSTPSSSASGSSGKRTMISSPHRSRPLAPAYECSGSRYFTGDYQDVDILVSWGLDPLCWEIVDGLVCEIPDRHPFEVPDSWWSPEKGGPPDLPIQKESAVPTTSESSTKTPISQEDGIYNSRWNPLVYHDVDMGDSELEEGAIMEVDVPFALQMEVDARVPQGVCVVYECAS